MAIHIDCNVIAEVVKSFKVERGLALVKALIFAS